MRPAQSPQGLVGAATMADRPAEWEAGRAAFLRRRRARYEQMSDDAKEARQRTTIAQFLADREREHQEARERSRQEFAQQRAEIDRVSALWRQRMADKRATAAGAGTIQAGFTSLKSQTDASDVVNICDGRSITCRRSC